VLKGASVGGRARGSSVKHLFLVKSTPEVTANTNFPFVGNQALLMLGFWAVPLGAGGARVCLAGKSGVYFRCPPRAFARTIPDLTIPDLVLVGATLVFSNRHRRFDKRPRPRKKV